MNMYTGQAHTNVWISVKGGSLWFVDLAPAFVFDSLEANCWILTFFDVLKKYYMIYWFSFIFPKILRSRAEDNQKVKISCEEKCDNSCLPECQGDFLAVSNRKCWKIVQGLRFLLPKPVEMNIFHFPPHFRRRYPSYREAILEISVAKNKTRDSREGFMRARFKPNIFL